MGRSRVRVADGSSEQSSDRRQLTAHQRAVADLFVAHVDTDPSDQFRVKSFRDEGLHRRLVRNAQSWVEREVRRQGAPTIENGAVSLLSMRLHADVVHWPTRRGGVLDHLRQISERLAHYYGWDQADAALFVITGITPRVQAIRGDVQLKFPLPARSKIVLTIDPTATPSEVAAAYGSVRRCQFGWLRRPAAKHTALAVSLFDISQCRCGTRCTPGTAGRVP